MTVNLPTGIAKSISRMSELSPLKQRLIIGVTALPMMTAIDYYNPFVDKDTRKTSAIRTAIKTIICTASGLLTRYLGGKIGAKMVSSGAIAVPAGLNAAQFTKRVADVFMVMGGIISVFAIDLPFINKSLNFVMDKVGNKKGGPQPLKPEKSGVNHYA
jgi:hypothetical protein